MDKKLYKFMDWAAIEGIVYSEDDDPHRLLGSNWVKGGLLFQAFKPGAKSVTAIIKTEEGEKNHKMEMVDEEGYFAYYLKTPGKVSYTYRFKTVYEDREVTSYDPYDFEPTIPKEVLKKFNLGISYDIYDFLGSHLRTIDGITGVSFAVWAPNAVRVSVVGDFNGWDGRVHQMRRLGSSGVFEIFIPEVKEGDIYKYELKLKGGLISLKADPYGFGSQLRPESASVVRNIDDFSWTDNDFVKNRGEFNSKNKAFSVYELYLGSFTEASDGREFPTYRELAPKIAEYVKKMGYTHIELMPVMEHPLDESWGYQVIGYYAPTSRYGKPSDFMYFIDYMHRENIGVILDWVPAHFPKDVQGLSSFDGTCLYEHADPRLGVHPHWGTLLFNYGRPEVSNYLIANALFWIEKYHADGIRMDAVATMLYRDYGRNEGEWIPNVYGGKENLEAIEMIKHLNSINKKLGTGALMIAEESTAWPKVTGELDDEGLGFDYKWNMGWMNDFLDFIRIDPLFRSGSYGQLTFSMIYAYSEKFQLVFSHDEVVHGKASLIAKMPGDKDKQFANMRAAFGYMFTHPGKKLCFMGQDIAEYDEWNEKRCVQWDLLSHDNHKFFNNYIKDLNALYKSESPLYELDNVPEGFEWINNISANETILVFLRKDEAGRTLLIVLNFADAPRNNYKIGVPFEGMYKEIFSSDNEKYGGYGMVNPRVKASKKSECDGREDSIKIKVAPLSVSIFSCTPISEYNKTSKSTKK